MLESGRRWRWVLVTGSDRSDETFNGGGIFAARRVLLTIGEMLIP
jgi:hypothetical protein